MTNPGWITTRSASEQTGVPKRTIIAAINRGELPAQKLPGVTGSFLIAPIDLGKWIAKREAKAAS